MGGTAHPTALDARSLSLGYDTPTKIRDEEGVQQMGLMIIIAICLVGIFQLTMRAPRKDGHH